MLGKFRIAAADFFVSTNGNDAWSGRLPEPAAGRMDGPFASMDGARQALRRLKATGALSGSVTVWIRGGRYTLAKPVEFTADDTWPVTYEAYPGEEAVFTGGRRLENWRKAEHDGHIVWVTDIPEVAAGQWYFRQFFVNGARRARPRLPKHGFFKVVKAAGQPAPGGATGTDSFQCAEGDIRSWSRLADVEVVALHLWVEERMPITAFDAATRIVTCSRQSVYALDQAVYYVDNVYEALSDGEWYLDRAGGRLTYRPLPGETLDALEAWAPVAKQLVVVAGAPEAGRFVEHLRFKKLCFEYTDWEQPADKLA